MKQITIDLNECGIFIVNLTGDGGGGCTSNQHYEWNDKNTRKVFANIKEWSIYEGQIDTIESLVLSHAISGIDVNSEMYKEGLKTTLQAIGNQ